MKEFNTTGICIPEKHYMADTSKVIFHIIDELVDKIVPDNMAKLPQLTS